MITLSLKDTGALLGTIDEADLRMLIDQLEEETEEDTDYYITAQTIDLLEKDGASVGLLQLLKTAVGGSEGVDVAWQRT
jgi:hypothetical protein